MLTHGLCICSREAEQRESAPGLAEKAEIGSSREGGRCGSRQDSKQDATGQMWLACERSPLSLCQRHWSLRKQGPGNRILWEMGFPESGDTFITASVTQEGAQLGEAWKAEKRTEQEATVPGGQGWSPSVSHAPE